MKEKCIEKLNEWFDGADFHYEIVSGNDDEYIFSVVYDDYDGKIFSLIHVFNLGNKLQLSEDYSQNASDNESMAFAIAGMMKAYARVVEE